LGWVYYVADAAKQMTQMPIAYSTDPVRWTDTLDHPILAGRPKILESRAVEPDERRSSTMAGFA
jgi:hypothetical protein